MRLFFLSLMTLLLLTLPALSEGESSASVLEQIEAAGTVEFHLTRGMGPAVKLKPLLPPVLRDQFYVIRFEGGDRFRLKQGAQLTVSISRGNEEKAFLEETYRGGDEMTEFVIPSAFLGVGERFQLILAYSENGTRTFRQSFRILSPQQKESLEQAERELMKKYEGGHDILSLLRLASECQALDQNRLVLKYLRMAYESPYLEDEVMWTRLRESVQKFQAAVEMALPLIPGE